MELMSIKKGMGNKAVEYKHKIMKLIEKWMDLESISINTKLGMCSPLHVYPIL